MDLPMPSVIMERLGPGASQDFRLAQGVPVGGQNTASVQRKVWTKNDTTGSVPVLNQELYTWIEESNTPADPASFTAVSGGTFPTLTIMPPPGDRPDVATVTPVFTKSHFRVRAQLKNTHAANTGALFAVMDIEWTPL